MGATLTPVGIMGAVIAANLLTVWLVWGVREFARTRGKSPGPSLWAWVAVLIPSLLIFGAVAVSAQMAS